MNPLQVTAINPSIQVGAASLPPKRFRNVSSLLKGVGCSVSTCYRDRQGYYTSIITLPFFSINITFALKILHTKVSSVILYPLAYLIFLLSDYENNQPR